MTIDVGIGADTGIPLSGCFGVTQYLGPSWILDFIGWYKGCQMYVQSLERLQGMGDADSLLA